MSDEGLIPDILSEEEDEFVADPTPVPIDKLDAYSHLLLYDDHADIPLQAVADKAGIPLATVAAYVGQLKNNPKISSVWRSLGNRSGGTCPLQRFSSL